MPEGERSSQTQPLDNSKEKNIRYMPAFHDRFHFSAQSLVLEVSASATNNLEKRSLRQILKSVQRSALLPLRQPITFLAFIQTNQA